jgi:probable addiction module antidote protein
MISTVSHHDFMMKYLASPAEAAAYLNCVAEDNDLDFLLESLRDVVEAQGGVGELAKKTGMSRTSLYKTLSPKGNPEVGTLDAILAIYGIRIGFFPMTKKTIKRRATAERIGRRRQREAAVAA